MNKRRRKREKKRKQISKAAVFWFFADSLAGALLIRMRAALRANIKGKKPTQSILLLLFLLC